MTGVHLHLLLTHVPVIGIIFGTLILAYAWMRRSGEGTRIGLGLFVLSGLAALVVYFTGEAAEHAVEGLAGVSEAIIERHEEAAVAALVAALVLGAVSLLGLWRTRRDTPRWLSGGVLALALIVSGIMAWTANLGGQINHPEIRPGADQVSLVQDADRDDAREHGEDDD